MGLYKVLGSTASAVENEMEMWRITIRKWRLYKVNEVGYRLLVFGECI